MEAVIQGRLDFCSLPSPFNRAFVRNQNHEILYAFGTDYPCHNGVLAKDQDRVPPEKEIDEIIEVFKAKKLPFMYWSSAEILKTKGFQLAGVLNGMYLNLLENFLRQTVSNIHITRVQTREEAQVFTQLAADSFGLNETAAKQWTEVNTSLIESPDVVHYLAYHEEVPVGTLTLVTSHKVAGIWNLSTHPDYRNHGIGTTLVYTALQDAKKRNIPHAMAILMPKGLARGLFTKLGFEKCGEFPFYIYGFNEPLEK